MHKNKPSFAYLARKVVPGKFYKSRKTPSSNNFRNDSQKRVAHSQAVQFMVELTIKAVTAIRETNV